jgi:transcriptional regulator
MKSTYRNLTGAELYAIELRARRMRQEEIGRLLRVAAQAVNAAYHRAISQFSAKGVRHA